MIFKKYTTIRGLPQITRRHLNIYIGRLSIEITYIVKGDYIWRK